MNEILKKSLVLMTASGVAAFFLAVTYNMTKEKIEKYWEGKTEKAKKEVLPGATKFKEEIGYNKDGRRAGIALKSYGRGYGGKIEIILGINLDGKIEGVKIMKQKETPGIGTKIFSSWFLEQFKGLKKEEVVLKDDSPEGKISAISGATISSKGLINAAKNGFNEFKKYIASLEKKEILSRTPDGVYRGVGAGFSGPILIEVKVKEHKIENIVILEQSETKKFWKAVTEKIPKAILKDQTIDVDIISGATYTSKGLINAIENALRKGKNEGDKF